MVTTKLNLSMTEPSVRQIYAKQGDTGRVLDITLDQTPEDGTLRILRPDGTEVTSEAVTGGEVSESGETVTFESLTEADVTELTVGIEPVQDLNGHDKPWVGGAGKNLLPMTLANLKAIQSANGSWSGNTYTLYGVSYAVGTDDGGNVISITVNGTATQYSLFYLVGAISFPFDVRLSGCASGGSYSGYRLQAEGGTIRQDIGNGVQIPANEEKTRIIIAVPSGGSASSAVFKPMIRLATEADATFEPYSNICPITGHDEVTVARTGKNLARIRDVDATMSGITWQSDGASIHVNGTATSNSSPFSGAQVTNFDTMLNGVYPAGTYTVSCRGWEMSQTADRMTVNAKYADGTGVSGVDGQRITPSTIGGQPNDKTFTATKPFKIDFWCNIQSGSTVDFTATIQLELGSTATSHVPYQGSTYTTSLGQTVYGGTLDMVSGVLTVDRVFISTTWANGQNATSLGSYTRKKFNLGAMFLYAPSKTQSNVAPLVDGYSLDELHFYCYNRVAYVFLPNDTDGATPIQVCCPLATSTTYQLTPQQIKTLVGTNNVRASSGDIVNITFTYGGLLSELPSQATEIVGKCYCDVEQNGVSSMPFTLNVKKNERQ